MPSSSPTTYLDDTIVKVDNDRENDNNHDHDDDHNDDDDRNDDDIERLMVPVDPATGVGSSKRKLSTVTLLGISIGILFTVVVGMSFAFATNNKNKGSGHKREVISAADGTGDVTTTIVYEEVDPPLIKEDKDAEAGTSLDDENDPRNEMVTGKGLAEIPVGLVDFIKKVVSVPAAGRGRHSINIPPDMLHRMNGFCSFLEEYEPAENTNYFQCSTDMDNPNFPFDDDSAEEKKHGYTPSDELYELWSKATNVSVEALRKIHIGSGLETHAPGVLCSMPLPPEDQINAREYWKLCIQPRAGFFNALQCKGLCEDPTDVETCSTVGVIGYALMEEGVCYPSHMHQAEEGYWQIAGRGWWKTWFDQEGSFFGDDRYITTQNTMGSDYAFHAQRQGVVHEMDTTANLDGTGQATIRSPMVMIYFWGLSTALDNNYRYVPDLKDQQISGAGLDNGSCATERRIPPRDSNQTITTNNC